MYICWNWAGTCAFAHFRLQCEWSFSNINWNTLLKWSLILSFTFFHSVFVSFMLVYLSYLSLFWGCGRDFNFNNISSYFLFIQMQNVRDEYIESHRIRWLILNGINVDKMQFSYHFRQHSQNIFVNRRPTYQLSTLLWRIWIWSNYKLLQWMVLIGAAHNHLHLPHTQNAILNFESLIRLNK